MKRLSIPNKLNKSAFRNSRKKSTMDHVPSSANPLLESLVHEMYMDALCTGTEEEQDTFRRAFLSIQNHPQPIRTEDCVNLDGFNHGICQYLLCKIEHMEKEAARVAREQAERLALIAAEHAAPQMVGGPARLPPVVVAANGVEQDLGLIIQFLQYAPALVAAEEEAQRWRREEQGFEDDHVNGHGDNREDHQDNDHGDRQDYDHGDHGGGNDGFEPERDSSPPPDR